MIRHRKHEDSMDDEATSWSDRSPADDQPADSDGADRTDGVDGSDAAEQEWLLGTGDSDLDWGAGSRLEGWLRRLAELGAAARDAGWAAERAAVSCFERIRPAVARAGTQLQPAIRALTLHLAVILWRLRMFVLHTQEIDHERNRPPRWGVRAMRSLQLRVVGVRHWRMKLMIVASAICLLLACTLPPFGAIGGALDEYHALRTLGDSGLEHLLAAKQYALDLATSAGLGELRQVLAPTGATPSRAAYTYMIQRQPGTDYRVTVTVHPAPGMASQGFADAHLQATIDANTLVRYGDATASHGPSGASTPLPPTASPPHSATATGIRAPQASPTSQTATLQAIGRELRAAQTAFATLMRRLGKPDWVLQAASRMQDTQTKLTSAAALAQIGYDVATVGIELDDAVTPLLTRIHQGALSGQGNLVTATDLDAMQRALTHAVQSIDALSARLRTIDLRGLSLSQQQITLFSQQIAQLPTLRDAAQQIIAWLPAIDWILGVGQPRHFLVQTLDRTELRPSGGFTGDYGVLTLGKGRLEPFELYNINDIEYGYKSNGWIYGQRPPPPYRWWPFADWGLRDSNLSADFPTTAKINMQLFHNEGGGDVDGVIQLTPTVIAHLLRVTGPIVVPGYNETITADNLEERIQFYQQDPRGIAIEQRLNPTDHTHSLRKRFTQLVTQLLQEKVKQLGENQLLLLARQLVDDLKAKNLQVYVTNAQVEDLLTKLHAAGAMETTPGVDSYMLVQANVSVAKSTPYVQLSQTDDVTLDDQGGATHRLTVVMDNKPTGPIYGYPTYRDYLRIYVPATARFTYGWGFDQMWPICYTPPPPPSAPPVAPVPTPTSTSTPTPTPTPAPPVPPRPPQYAGVPDCTGNPYWPSERVCPANYYGWDGEASKVLGWDDKKVPALGAIGPATNTSSDMPGFAMRGGYVVIPQFCTARVTLSWYVPNVAHLPPPSAGHHTAALEPDMP